MIKAQLMHSTAYRLHNSLDSADPTSHSALYAGYRYPPHNPPEMQVVQYTTHGPSARRLLHHHNVPDAARIGAHVG